MFFDNWIYGVAYGNKSENQAPRMRKISKVLKTLRISRVGMPRIHARGEHIRLACKLCSWKREAPTSNEVKWWVVHQMKTKRKIAHTQSIHASLVQLNQTC